MQYALMRGESGSFVPAISPSRTDKGQKENTPAYPGAILRCSAIEALGVC
jgi:hypothetical protein